jgi:hypothetical protein
MYPSPVAPFVYDATLYYLVFSGAMADVQMCNVQQQWLSNRLWSSAMV